MNRADYDNPRVSRDWRDLTAEHYKRMPNFLKRMRKNDTNFRAWSEQSQLCQAEIWAVGELCEITPAVVHECSSFHLARLDKSIREICNG